MSGQRNFSTVLTLGKDDIYFTGAEWAFEPFWMSAEYVTFEIRSPERHPVEFPYTQNHIADHNNVKI